MAACRGPSLNAARAQPMPTSAGSCRAAPNTMSLASSTRAANGSATTGWSPESCSLVRMHRTARSEARRPELRPPHPSATTNQLPSSLTPKASSFWSRHPPVALPAAHRLPGVSPCRTTLSMCSTYPVNPARSIRGCWGVIPARGRQSSAIKGRQRGRHPVHPIARTMRHGGHVAGAVERPSEGKPPIPRRGAFQER